MKIALMDIIVVLRREMMLQIGLRLWDVVGNAHFNFHIAKK